MESISKVQHRKPSDLAVEAVRAYLAIPAVAATKAEIRAIRRGRAEYNRGQYVSLDRALHALERRTHSIRRKSTR
ncbi:MAG TPA: hypothetical protein VFC63_12145 [Blastocatellia bacterium]|nr:hypothetical protein [Blastocatellia bacterium]